MIRHSPVTARVLSRIIPNVKPRQPENRFVMLKIRYRPECSRLLAAGFVLAVAAALSACTGDDFRYGYSRQKESLEGLNVAPADYKNDILAVAHTYLNNPRRIRDASISEPFLKNIGARGDRYIVCVRFNAMNTDGKYTGLKSRIATYRRGKLDQFAEAVPERLPDQKEDAADPCKDVAMQPFSELEKLSP